MTYGKHSMVGLFVILLASAAFGAAPAAAFEPAARAADEPPLRLLLNVPAHRLYVYEHGELTHTFRIAVGLPGYETPSGRYRVSNVIWNPWWHPPQSEWARNRQIEPPGPDNPMGRVKMFFSDLLYIHGNPEIGMLGRAASRGCIRMSNEEAMELARLIHSYTTPNVSQETLDQLAANEKQTRQFNLPRSVPFEVIYEVAEVRDGYLIIYPDVYGKMRGDRFDNMVRAVLMDHGLTGRNVNRQHLERLLEKGRTAIVSASLEELASSAAGEATESFE
jgi:murein L,D-transpeptidase YcbB/YkuD